MTIYERLAPLYEELTKRGVYWLSDNDGCIILTEETIHRPSWWKYGIMSYTEEVSNRAEDFIKWVERCRGVRTTDNVVKALRLFGCEQDQKKADDVAWVELESRKKEEFVEYLLPERCPFNEGGRETLELWNGLKVPWGIVTSAREFKQIYIPKFPEFATLVDQEIATTPDLVTRGKPDPMPFKIGSRKVKEKYGLSDDAIMCGIEDAYSGVISLIRAGADIIFVIGDAITKAQRRELEKIHPRIYWIKDFRPFLDEVFLSKILEVVNKL